jgi:hypothetical protein
VASDLAEIAYEASLRRLDKQDELLGEIRSRTGLLLAASSLTAPEVHRRLAYDLDRFWQDNDRTLQRVFGAFRVAAWSLGAEVVLLLASLGGTIG